MNPKTLDALLLDRAAGQLPADVAQLLDAYLAQHPAAAAQGRRYDATVNMIRAASPQSTTARDIQVPPFPAQRIEAARSRRRVVAIVRPLAIAACLGLAFILGGKLAQSPGRPEPITIAVADAAPNGGFWAYPAARAAATSPRALASSPVRWSSPLRWPQPGGSS
jgi:anti-sigma factor RsiW